jgi:hypothetical protein
MFSTMGMALFKGKFHACNDGTLDGSLGQVALAPMDAYACRMCGPGNEQIAVWGRQPYEFVAGARLRQQQQQ